MSEHLKFTDKEKQELITHLRHAIHNYKHLVAQGLTKWQTHIDGALALIDKIHNS